MSFSPSGLKARQILDSRGNPTVEVDLMLADGSWGRAAVPSGASTGSHEAVELRDGGDRWSGKGVSAAVSSVTEQIAQAVTGVEFADQQAFDRMLLELDGTPNKGRLGANAVLGCSLAFARACAGQSGEQLWKRLPSVDGPLLPVPMLNIVNGGAHANNGLDVQEFMIVPHGFDRFSDALEAAVGVFHTLKADLARRGLSTAVGDEGGFAPTLGSNTEALELIVAAIEKAGWTPGEQISLALDVAATEFYAGTVYEMRADDTTLTADALVEMYDAWIERFPIVSIEDGMSEDDWDGWRQLTDVAGERVQLVGDDLFVTDPTRIKRGIEAGVANAVLVKVNQIGTLSETLDAMHTSNVAGYRCVMSHRSGETEDSIIADLAVGTGCGQIKTGAPSRSDRVAKYNQLLRIEELLGSNARYATPFTQRQVSTSR